MVVGEGQSGTGSQGGKLKSGYDSSRTKAGGLAMWLEQRIRQGPMRVMSVAMAPSEIQMRECSPIVSQVSHLHFMFHLEKYVLRFFLEPQGSSLGSPAFAHWLKDKEMHKQNFAIYKEKIV